MTFKKKEDEVKIKIAEIVIEATSAQDDLDLDPSPEHRRFMVAGCTSDISLRYHYGRVPPRPPSGLIFASGGLWSLYHKAGKCIIVLANPFPGTQPYRLAVMERTLHEGEVYFRRSKEAAGENLMVQDFAGPRCADPFEYPLDEVLMVNFLAQGRGAILHACGVVDNDRGFLFVGVSGAGKSTIAKLWKKTEVTLLSDDRIIVRPTEGCFRMYGTPWHGDALISSPGNAPLEHLFFIEHAHQNYVKALTPSDAAARLMVRCFPPFYDREGMEFTLKLLAQIAEKIPCFELGFVPDASAIDFVRGVK